MKNNECIALRNYIINHSAKCQVNTQKRIRMVFERNCRANAILRCLKIST